MTASTASWTALLVADRMQLVTIVPDNSLDTQHGALNAAADALRAELTHA
jgi:hypothetical protein